MPGMNNAKAFVPCTLTLTERLLARLDAVAKREDRTRSAMARVLISEGLTQRGPANFDHALKKDETNVG